MRCFDHIVVGAGSAGCALASRLAADPASKVLLIEAGARRHPLAHIPGAVFFLMKTGAANWGYSVDMGWRSGHRRATYARGKLLGGSSAINGMLYVRGAPEDYDHWLALGNKGWGYQDVLPYFKRAETYLGTPAAHRGTSGPLQVARQDEVNQLTEAWVRAGVQAGLPHNDDINGAVQEGIGLPDFTLARGVRSSTARAYLGQPPPNLTIIANAQVTGILMSGRRATGVSYLERGVARRALADGDVILSAGTFNSPHLLLNSGIGDGNALRALGIPVVADLPGVGGNLQDHPAVFVMMTSREPVSLYRHLSGWGMAAAALKYGFTRKGPIGASGLEGISFIRSRPAVELYDCHNHFVPALFTDQGRTIIPKHGFMNILCLSRPHSRGRLTLGSANPLDPPVIDMNYLDDERDLLALRDAVREVRKVLAQPALGACRGEELAPGAEVTSDAALNEYMCRTVEPNYHAVGTCAMGSGPDAVVDDQLRVHGIDHLRVADASIMPRIIGGNTNAPTIMIGEKAADLILGNRALAA